MTKSAAIEAPMQWILEISSPIGPRSVGVLFQRALLPWPGGGSRLSTRGLLLYLHDPWLALLQIHIENDVHLVLDLGVLREHAPQQRARAPKNICRGAEVPVRSCQKCSKSNGRIVAVGPNGLGHCCVKLGQRSIRGRNRFDPIECQREDEGVHHSPLGLPLPGEAC